MEENYIKQLGNMAMASRLKQLTELLMRDMVKVYQEFHVDFEPRWFTFIHLLSQDEQLSITEISKRLNQSHVAANQVANALEEKKLIQTSRDRNDQRKRILKLSAKGRKLVNELQPVWRAVDKATAALLEEADSTFFSELEKIENALSEKPMYARINKHVDQEILSQVKITKYLPVHKHTFIDLNLAWLEKYFVVESHDQKLLFNPDEEIIGKGGEILVAVYRDEVIGTVALLRVDDTIAELTKMAVIEKLQGHGIGRKLLSAMVTHAKNKGYKKLVLLTSPKLEAALKLYTSFGFTESKEKSLLLDQLERCSIQMQIDIE